MTTAPSTREARGRPDAPDWLAIVRTKVTTLEYGVVQIVVHDSRVVQIERTEKTRLDSKDAC